MLHVNRKTTTLRHGVHQMYRWWGGNSSSPVLGNYILGLCTSSHWIALYFVLVTPSNEPGIFNIISPWQSGSSIHLLYKNSSTQPNSRNAQGDTNHIWYITKIFVCSNFGPLVLCCYPWVKCIYKLEKNCRKMPWILVSVEYRKYSHKNPSSHT